MRCTRSPAISDPSLNPSTIYRTLAWLENAGLVSHCHLDAGPAGEHSERYDPVTPVEHHHFVCTTCGQVIEFEAPQLEAIKAGVCRRAQYHRGKGGVDPLRTVRRHARTSNR